ncbi:hypothetical protein RCH10_003389 [Variovorax sp. GrIS 2.14]
MQVGGLAHGVQCSERSKSQKAHQLHRLSAKPSTRACDYGQKQVCAVWSAGLIQKDSGGVSRRSCRRHPRVRHAHFCLPQPPLHGPTRATRRLKRPTNAGIDQHAKYALPSRLPGDDRRRCRLVRPSQKETGHCGVAQPEVNREAKLFPRRQKRRLQGNANQAGHPRPSVGHLLQDRAVRNIKDKSACKTSPLSR